MDQNDFSLEFMTVLTHAEQESYTRGQDTISAELFLHCLLEDPFISTAMQQANIDVVRLQNELHHIITMNHEQWRFSHNGDENNFSIDLKQIMARAYAGAQRRAGRTKVTPTDVLLSYYAQGPECVASTLLTGYISRFDFMTAVKAVDEKIDGEKNKTRRIPINRPPAHQPRGANDNGTSLVTRPAVEEDEPEPGDALQAYCVNLMDNARKGKIDPLIGRKEEVKRTVQILSRRSKNNPLYVGEPGVGKTAIAEGLARRIFNDEVPEVMKHDRVFALDLGLLIAGTRYRGDFEERLKNVIAELKEYQEALADHAEKQGVDFSHTRKPKVHLFIDEIHTLVGAGATSGGAMDASNILKPALARGEISCIGATTYKEFRNHFEKDKALVRRFQKIDVSVPTVEDTIKILNGLKSYFEEFHKATYTDEAIEKAARLAARYIHDRHLPDSAIDVIDEAGAALAAKGIKPEKRRVGVKQIEKVVSSIARIPPKSISQNDAEVLQSLEDDLKKAVYGQDQAIEAVSSAIKMARAGLREPEKPVGNYLFSGPTGVGKTEVAKQLAETLGVELHRFDMSEYMEKHAVSRLIGAPPGYVGFDQGGLLTDAVDKTPHCVLLLDEIEKAHPDLFNILLQVMDHGKLTDNNGKTVDFRNVILIMTSNAGAAEKEKNPIGFGATKDENDDSALRALFAPEFRNRLDAVIPFGKLGERERKLVVDKFIGQLEQQLADRQVTVSLDDGARGWLAEKGYDPAMGARPLGRVIQDFVKKPLSEAILFGDLKKGGNVHIVFNKEGEPPKGSPSNSPLRFTFNKASGAEKQEIKALPAPGPGMDGPQ